MRFISGICKRSGVPEEDVDWDTKNEVAKLLTYIKSSGPWKTASAIADALQVPDHVVIEQLHNSVYSGNI